MINIPSRFLTDSLISIALMKVKVMIILKKNLIILNFDESK